MIDVLAPRPFTKDQENPLYLAKNAPSDPVPPTQAADPFWLAGVRAEIVPAGAPTDEAAVKNCALESYMDRTVLVPLTVKSPAISSFVSSTYKGVSMALGIRQLKAPDS